MVGPEVRVLQVMLSVITERWAGGFCGLHCGTAMQKQDLHRHTGGDVKGGVQGTGVNRSKVEDWVGTEGLASVCSLSPAVF